MDGFSATAQEGVGKEYIVSGLTGNDKVTGIALSCNTEAGNAGDYDINAIWTSAPAWYEVVVVKGKYTIKPQEIDVTVKDQTLLFGEKLNQDAYTLSDESVKKDGEKWSDIFSLDYAVAAWANAQGEVLSTA